MRANTPKPERTPIPFDDALRRILSALFSRADRFPTSTDPPGIFLTQIAIPFLADVPFAPIADERRWVRIAGPEPGLLELAVPTRTRFRSRPPPWEASCELWRLFAIVSPI